MMDPGYIVIALFLGLFIWIWWASRARKRRRYPGSDSHRMPGERQEGAHLSSGGSGGDS